MSWLEILITIVAALLSGLLGVIISRSYYRKYEIKRTKLEILRNIMGYRYVLTDKILEDNNYIEAKILFFSSLNQCFIVFNDEKDVIKALVDYLDNNCSNNKLITLIKEISKSINIDCSQVNDSFIETPFVPTSRGKTK